MAKTVMKNVNSDYVQLIGSKQNIDEIKRCIEE